MSNKLGNLQENEAVLSFGACWASAFLQPAPQVVLIQARAKHCRLPLCADSIGVSPLIPFTIMVSQSTIFLCFMLHYRPWTWEEHCSIAAIVAFLTSTFLWFGGGIAFIGLLNHHWYKTKTISQLAFEQTAVQPLWSSIFTYIEQHMSSAILTSLPAKHTSELQRVLWLPSWQTFSF